MERLIFEVIECPVLLEGLKSGICCQRKLDRFLLPKFSIDFFNDSADSLLIAITFRPTAAYSACFAENFCNAPCSADNPTPDRKSPPPASRETVRESPSPHFRQ